MKLPKPSTCVLAALGLLTISIPATIVADSEKPWAWRGQEVTEFTLGEQDEFGWEIVNDGVMGGLSDGKIQITDAGILKFNGMLSLKNNGGFTTFRSDDVDIDLSDDLGLLLLVKGDGRTYQARLSTDAKYRGMEAGFTGEFETKKGEWTQLKIPFSEFEAGFRGIELKDLKLDPSKIKRIGILLGDKKEGPFNLEIDWIRTYGKGQGNMTSAPEEKKAPASLVDIVVADGRFKTLATALTKADLLKVLSSKDEFTVFAPTDEAFAKVPKKLLEDLLLPENKEKLVSVLTYHVVSGKSALGDALKAKELSTVQGELIGVTFSQGAIRVNEATLIDSDITAPNGIIHAIDSVLLPPEPKAKTLLTTAEEAGAFKTLIAAVKAAGLTSALEGEKPLTVFAPSDEAFAALPKGTVESLLKKENREKLVKLLTTHVVVGKVSAGDALNAGEAKSLSGESLKFGIKDGLFTVNGSVIRTAGIEGGNGVIHVVGSVIGFGSTGASGDCGDCKTGECKATKGDCKGGDCPATEKCKQSDCPDSKKVNESKTTKVEEKGARESIVAAIEKGVPLYNGGYVTECVAVYRNCLEQLSESQGFDDHTRTMLGEVIASGEQHQEVDRAWFYRSALDRIMVLLSRQI